MRNYDDVVDRDSEVRLLRQALEQRRLRSVTRKRRPTEEAQHRIPSEKRLGLAGVWLCNIFQYGDKQG